MLTTNQVLHQGRYRIINSFSQDEMGGLYEAYDTLSDTNVVLRESLGAAEDRTDVTDAEFIDDAKALSEIQHESLVSVRDYFSEIDRQYLVLESVTGQDLAQYARPDAARPSLQEVVFWTDQLLNALHFLHTLKPPVLHRNITPGNIKLTAGHKVKLLTVPFSAASDLRQASDQTLDNAFYYRPLEQLWEGLDDASQRVILNSYDETSAGVLLRPLDARTDVYAIAASLYHVLTGTRPYDALERSIDMLDGKLDPLRYPTDLDPGIPPEISDVFMSALAVRREHRFDSAILMLQSLRTAVIRVEERKALQPASSSESIQKAKSADEARDITAAESQLALEREAADKRQREIESEQARLDEEGRRIERRRLELEAEKQRQIAEQDRLSLEAEQARVAAAREQERLEKERLQQETEKEQYEISQKLADLERRRSIERAEEERLERDAEVERTRAEDEQERHRVEQKRIEAEAQKERENGEQRLEALSDSPVRDDGDELLELEPPVSSASYAQAAVSPTEVDVPDFSSKPRSNSWVAVSIGAVVLLVAMAAGGWIMMSGNITSTQPIITEKIAAPANETEVKPGPAAIPVAADPQPEPAGSTSDVVPLTEDTAAPSDKTPSIKLNSVHEKVKKPVPQAAAPLPTPKKKVTVDDLIRDN